MTREFRTIPRLYQNATIMPFDSTMDAFTGGLFTEGGEFVDDSVVYRGKAPEYKAAVDELAGEYIYGGCLFAHFGHFIWESLARVPAFYAREYPILFISPNEIIFETWRLFFKSLGIRNRFIVIRKPTRVENLVYLPPQTSLAPARMSEEALNALGRKEFTETSDKKIWLSRSKLKYGRIVNESAIEKCVQRLGFEIVYPEKLPLPEQIRLIATSRVVAGFSGSQFFSSFFAKKILGAYKIFNRRPRVPDTLSFMLESKRINGEIVTLAVKEAVPGAPEKNMVALEPDKIIAALANFA